MATIPGMAELFVNYQIPRTAKRLRSASCTAWP